MSVNVPDTGIDLPAINQIAVVVEDLETAMESYHNLFNIGPWEVFEAEAPSLSERTYHGDPEEYAMRLGFADAGDLQVELIESKHGPNIYADQIENSGEGFHHIAYFSDSEPEIREMNKKFEDAGISMIQSGNLLGTDFWYFDTKDLLNGLIFETGVLRENPNRVPDKIYPE